jgi:hypothetical protein
MARLYLRKKTNKKGTRRESDNIRPWKKFSRREGNCTDLIIARYWWFMPVILAKDRNKNL